MKNKIRLIGLIVLALLAACTPTVGQSGGETATTPTVEPTETPASAAGLIDSAWVLVSYGDATPLAGSTVTLQFEENKLSGSAGCNSYFGDVTLDGDRITVGMLGQTEMWCENLMDQESAYLQMLGGAQSWQIRDSELSIQTEQGALVFRPPEAQAVPELAGSIWQLETLIGGDVAQSVLSGTRVTLELGADGQATGSTGCNSYGGSYTVDGSALHLGEMMQTLIGCSDELMAQESAYLAALAATESFELTADSLTLVNPAGALVFRLPQSQSLEGTQWILSGIAQDDAVVSTWIDTDITAQFAAGELSGQAGCNQYSGSYTLDGATLQLGPVATTRMACVDERMERESQFLAALAQVANYSIKFDTLTLSDAAGKILLTFGIQRDAPQPVVTLERTPCFGACPVYRLSITADGTVTYEGMQFVAMTGVQYGNIGPEAVAELLAAFESAGYLGWQDAYTQMTISDAPTVISSVTINGVTKQIQHYHGDDSAPAELAQLEDLVDSTVNVAQWTRTSLSGPVSLPWLNPAFEYCLAQGGYYEERNDDQGGVYGVCNTPAGESCAAWAYLSGVCLPAESAGDALDSPVSVDSFALDPMTGKMLVSGHYPDGCTRVASITAELSGSELRINLHGLRPAGVECTEALEPFSIEFALQGVVLEPGTELSITMNNLSRPVLATLGGLEKTIYVAPEQAPCGDAGEQSCLQFREDPAGEWLPLDGEISGFAWEPGYRYELRVLEVYQPAPPADTPAVFRTLLEQVSKVTP